MKLAAIDIGSNSIKLIIVEATGGDSFTVLAREKDVARLGHDTLRERHLSPAAVTRAVAAIGRFQFLADAQGADRVVAIATASVRSADNADQFVAEVEKQTGVRVEVLSGLEEARLIGLAAARGCGLSSGEQLNVDIGGGSTELSVMRDGTPAELYSVRLGAVGLTERFITSDPVKQKELRALREEIILALERPARELRESRARWQLTTGTSGTILAIGEALRGRAPRANGLDGAEAKISGSEVTLEELVRFNAGMAALSLAERRAVQGISGQRAEIIVAGGQLLEGVMRALKVGRLYTCDWALREGVIIDRLRELEAETRPPVSDEVDPRLQSVCEFGRRFRFEEAHALRVARHAEKLFDAVAAAYNLRRHERTLLSAAALLHDVGYAVAHESHHKHSLYLIKHAEITGFSESERLVIANVARYHRRSLPKERHADFASLPEADRATVWRLGGILRLAEALDRSHDARVRELRFVCEKGTVRADLLCEESCERELVAAEQRRDMFEQAFDAKIFFRQFAQQQEAGGA